MGEPIELKRNGETLIVHAPTFAANLIRDEGWTLASDVALPPAESLEPIEGYADMTVGAILEAAETMTPERRLAIYTYEASNKRRVTILRALEA